MIHTAFLNLTVSWQIEPRKMKTRLFPPVACLLMPLLLAPTSLAQTYKILHSFSAGPSDGGNPLAGLIADRSGNFYGTTSDGGSSDNGTVFKITSSGQETILWSFGGNPDGQNPSASLVFDSSGDLYGTTSRGGANGLGTVFKIGSTGGETVLYSFTGGTDGGEPKSSLVLDNDGNLYGTTTSGGL